MIPLNRRSFLATSAAAATAAYLPGQARRRPPNIVLILADDLGYGELGCQGNAEIPTPHIDSIARNGVRFTNGYVSAPFCCPSRAGLLTGRYQTRFGHELNVVGKLNLDPKVGLPLEETTVASALKAAGYATGAIGKWHLGTAPHFHPQNRGFEEFFGFLQEGHFYNPLPHRGLTTRLRTNEPPYDEENPILRGATPVTEPDYLTKAFTREATAFIDRHAARPFFLYLPYNAVHSPMQAPVTEVPKFQDRIHDEQRRLFAAMLSQMDDGIGQVLARLRKHALENETLVIFLSDNGGPTVELTSSNKPLRGGKGQLFEGGIRIPFLMQWPGRIAANHQIDTPVISLDLFATASAAAAAKLPGKPIDGVNLLPLLASGPRQISLSREALYWRYGPNMAIRKGRWKLVRQGSERFQLFDLENDAAESRDLAGQQPALAESLRRELDAMNAQMAPPLWGQRAQALRDQNHRDTVQVT